jgi:hypothetical protein
MNHDGQKIAMRGRCRPDRAGAVVGVLATKMPLLTELELVILGHGINDLRLFYKTTCVF